MEALREDVSRVQWLERIRATAGCLRQLKQYPDGMLRINISSDVQGETLENREV
jgi:hypothetical protein